MDGATFIRRVRDLAVDDRNIVFVAHARVRMRARNRSPFDVQRALLRGIVEEGPFRNAKGHWQATITGQAAGQVVRVAVALERRLIVITVMV
jgi:hypothetical protein